MSLNQKLSQLTSMMMLVKEMGVHCQGPFVVLFGLCQHSLLPFSSFFCQGCPIESLHLSFSLIVPLFFPFIFVKCLVFFFSFSSSPSPILFLPGPSCFSSSLSSLYPLESLHLLCLIPFKCFPFSISHTLSFLLSFFLSHLSFSYPFLLFLSLTLESLFLYFSLPFSVPVSFCFSEVDSPASLPFCFIFISVD